MERNDDLKKVVLVGTGLVGMSMAYSVLNTGGIDELVLIDIDQEKAIGEAMDISPVSYTHLLGVMFLKVKLQNGMVEIAGEI